MKKEQKKLTGFEATVLAASACLGGLVMVMDTRPHMDDTGITAVALLSVAAACAAILPRRLLPIGLLVGLWIPVHGLLVGDPKECFAILPVLMGLGVGYLANRAYRAACRVKAN